MLCELTVKVGEITKTSRTNVPSAERLFEWDAESSFEALSRLVSDAVARDTARYQPRVERVDSALYLRPAMTAAQKDFIELTADNLRVSIATAQVNYARRKKQTGPFVFSLFVFVAKAHTPMNAIRRATKTRVAEASAAVEGFLDANPDVQLGDIARTHLVLTHARQPDATPVSLPDTATFRQMRHLDAMRRAEEQPRATDAELKTINVRLNDSTPLQLTVDVRELRAALGLPDYNFVADGIFHTFVAPPPPEVDVEDLDHQSDPEEN